ncbi:MAG: hypothetical protein AB1410_09365 [Acidobacteriota bacterium]
MKKLRKLIVLYGILLLLPCLLKSEIKFSFALNGGYYFPSARTFNSEIVTYYNDRLDFWRDVFDSAGAKTNLKELKEIEGNLFYGGEIDLEFYDRYILSFGIGKWKYEPAYELKGVFETNNKADEFKFSGDFLISILPLNLTVKYIFPFRFFNCYAGAGAGYYVVKFSNSILWEENVEGKNVYFSRSEMKAVKRKLVPHLDAGVEFPIPYLKSFSLCLDLKYILGNLKDFEVKKNTENPEQIGKSLMYENKYGENKVFIFELSGISLNIFVKYKF